MLKEYTRCEVLMYYKLIYVKVLKRLLKIRSILVLRQPPSLIHTITVSFASTYVFECLICLQVLIFAKFIIVYSQLLHPGKLPALTVKPRLHWYQFFPVTSKDWIRKSYAVRDRSYSSIGTSIQRQVEIGLIFHCIVKILLQYWYHL